ncbi:MAG TPA: MinD/ParA family protein [Gammaproteobacteria bacterium]|nr:MinD/ParA family protein [Gammaproteobacteria bacterium]
MPETYFDQAAGLRRLSAPRSVKVVAITGGKGGVGKTLTAVNLGAALAQLGRSTMLLDADFGLANVDVLLGMKARLNLEHVMSGTCALEDVILTSTSGLRVVPATSGSVSMATLSRVQHAGLIGAFSQLLEPLDVLLVDTAAGLTDGVITFSEAAQRVVVLVCDEPASLTDAYGLIKVLSRRQPSCRFEVVANMVDSPVQGRELYEKLMRVCHRFLGITPAYFGYVPNDDYVRQAIRRQATVVEAFPSSPAARAFQRLARVVDEWDVPAQARGGVEFFMERLVRADRECVAGVQ